MKLQNIKLTDREKADRQERISQVQLKQEKMDAFIIKLAAKLERGEITDAEYWNLQFQAEKNGSFN